MLHAMAAEEPPREERPFTEAGTVVLDDVVGGHASAFGTVPYGGIGTYSIGWASFASSRVGESTARAITVAPSIDVFVTEGFSLGAMVAVSAAKTEFNGNEASAYAGTIMPRIGEAFSLSRDVIVWPRLAAGVTVAEGPDALGSTLAHARFDVPFVFVVTRHVAFDVGPELGYTMQLDHGDARTVSGGVNGGLSLFF